MYATDVVARVVPLGIKIAHDFEERDGAIPFPATFSIALADALTDPASGVNNRLYSDHPFLFSKNEGLKDEFELLALTTLRFRDDPSKPFVRYETLDGRRSLRYATAMIMKQAYVDCHNTHPASPKRDWQIGDVRGVRAVTFPVDKGRAAVNFGWAGALAEMLTTTGIGLGIFLP